jgi:sialic acid synthase SpsE
MLEVLGCPRYKIASFEIVDLDLIGVVSTTGKPIIISTGMATQEEIGSAVSAAHSSHVTLLKCVSGYPADPADYNLNTMHNMRLKFNLSSWTVRSHPDTHPGSLRYRPWRVDDREASDPVQGGWAG